MRKNIPSNLIEVVSLYGKQPSSLPQFLQKTGDSANPFEELRERVFLVWRVQVIIGQAKAHQDYRCVQYFIEEGRDGNGATRAQENGVFTVSFLQGCRSGSYSRCIYWDQHSLSTVDVMHNYLHSCRCEFFHTALKERECFC